MFLFFRDAYLTRVTYRANDAYWWKIERLSLDREPELMRAMSRRTWRRHSNTLGLVYPIQKRRDQADYALEWLASRDGRPFGHALWGASRRPVRRAVRSRSPEGTETADDAGAGTDDHSIYDFDARLPKSLLPSMNRLAKDAGIRLVFIRVQRRPRPDGPPPQSAELTRYMQRLEAYLAASGVGF